MRIVANGEASPDELKKFQTHIDELTRLQKEARLRVNPKPPHNQSAPLLSSDFRSGQWKPKVQPPPALQSLKQRRLRNPEPAINLNLKLSDQKDHYLPQSQTSRVVFEFTVALEIVSFSPKFSILEYLPQGQVIASFLIVRKGSSSDSLHTIHSWIIINQSRFGCMHIRVDN